MKRYVSIWFPNFSIDRLLRLYPHLQHTAFVTAAPEKGKMMVKAASEAARQKGVYAGMAVADCRALIPTLRLFEDEPQQTANLLHKIAEWCIRFTPSAATDGADGLMLDVSGCPHLWGGEQPYLQNICTKIRAAGYNIRAAMADTIGCAWAVARFSHTENIAPAMQLHALLPLPPAALRLETRTLQKLHKLGLHQIKSIVQIPAYSLKRRFGETLLSRIRQALGQEEEYIQPVQPEEPFQSRLPCLEPVRTATAIEMALKTLIEDICRQLHKKSRGLRKCVFKGYRIDGNIQQISISTGSASRNATHLLKLFEPRIATIEPALGIELFMLQAPITEELSSGQEALWAASSHNNIKEVAELLDRIANRAGSNAIKRYLPQQHYWPTRSIKMAASLNENPQTEWRTDLPRPVHLLPAPERIDVTVPLPDYPPMLFRYKGRLHKVIKADGPERIEQEWWLQNGLVRDYYCIEDEEGGRFWLFRSGHYGAGDPQWFVHGFFA